MAKKLDGKKVAIVCTDGFEQSEMTEPRKALDAAGAKTVLVSMKAGKVKGWKHLEWGDEFPVDKTIAEVRVDDFDALMLPGGQMNPDKLRMDEKVVAFVRGFFEAGKPIAAICHGPWTLINAGAVKGRKMTSWPSIRLDLENAGASWVDAEVVVDKGLVTSRKPEDIPRFNEKMIEEFAEGSHDARGTADKADKNGSPGARPSAR
jgi:protease I